MTNNPGDANLFSIQTENDPSGFEAFRAQLDTIVSDAMDKFGMLSSTYGRGADSTYEYINALVALKDASFASGASIDQLKVQLEGLNEVQKSLAENKWQGYLGPEKAQSGYEEFLKGYGTTGGMIGPATEEEMPGKSGRSMFGIGHALSVAGFTLQAPGLKEAGAAVYMEQGLKQAIPMIEGFNDRIEKTPGLLSPLVSGLTALHIPMAGLVAVALPLAVGVAAVAVAVSAYNQMMAETKLTVDNAIAQLDAYYAAIATGTTEAIQKQLEGLEAKKAADDAEYAYLKGVVDKGVQDLQGFGQALVLPDFTGNVAKTQEALGLAAKRVDELGKEIDVTNAKIGGLKSALSSSNVAANDAAAAILKKADFDQKMAQQFAADDQMTSAAILKKIAANEQDQTSIQAQIDAIQKANSVVGLSVEQHQKNNASMDALIWKEAELIADTDHLKEVSMGLALAEERRVALLTAIQKLTDDAIAQDIKRADLERNATGKQVEDLIAKTDSDIAIVEARIAKLTAQAANSAEAAATVGPELEKLGTQLLQLKDDSAYYKDSLLAVAKANDAAKMAAETHAAQLDIFRRMLEEDAKAKAKEAADLKAADEAYAADKAKMLADQAARLAKSDAEEAEKEAEMRQDEALKEAAIGQKRSDEYLNDQAKLNTKIEDLQAAHGQKLVELQEQYASEDSQALLDHQAKLKDAALHLDAEAIYQENEAWRKKQQETTQQRAKEQNDLQVQLDRQIAQERKSLDDKYALEAAQDARTLAEMQARFAVELKQQQDHYANQRARQVAADGVDLADLDKAHTDKLNSIRNQYAAEAVQRQLDAWAQMQQVADTNARKLGIQVAGDAAIEAQFASFVARMMRQAENLNNMTATLTALGNEMNSRFGGLSSGSSGGSYYGGFAQGLTAFAEGTPDLGPTIRQVTTHPHESINNEDTSNLIRSQLGSSYSQSDLQNLIKGKGGVSIQNLTIPVTIGDAGGRTDDDLKRLFKATVKETFEEIANG